ncbi:hypothetical protein GKE82_18845 [Conexibacter sp. W3-3-2]|uniref:hypothetical protein n=1 Tax=Conexibacter sp. W3-3-2 TaxID=2675227 RepID=UPI0012B8C73D|nr:hypothetical protein [Conexibacter sp. W3-3-2]MTD46286.1 hypothetical protein [Conexibacter sp. W3-3-2]
MEPNTIQLVAIPERCYRCGQLTRGIVGVLAPTSRGHVFREFDDVSAALAQVLQPDDLATVRIGPIKVRRSRHRGAHLSNGCVVCGAILGSFPLWESLQEELSRGRSLRDFVVACPLGTL